MAKLRINGDSSGYVDLEAPNASSSSTLDLDQIPQKNVANTFTTGQNITVPGNGGLTIQAGTNGSASLRLKNDATDWDINCQTTDTFAIYNHTTGGSRLSITPAGIVTKPNQPCFVAGSGSSYSISTGGSLISHDHIFTNQGSHYNNTNKRFTAPATGKYYFWHRLVVGNGASGVIEAKIAVNGSEVIRDYSYVHGTSQYDNSIACGVIVLNSGDYVEPLAYWNGSSSTTVIGTTTIQITSWGGYLLG